MSSLAERSLFAELRAKILRVALALEEDENYTREEAVEALEDIADELLNTPGRARKVSTSHND